MLFSGAANRVMTHSEAQGLFAAAGVLTDELVFMRELSRRGMMPATG